MQSPTSCGATRSEIIGHPDIGAAAGIDVRIEAIFRVVAKMLPLFRFGEIDDRREFFSRDGAIDGDRVPGGHQPDGPPDCRLARSPLVETRGSVR